MEFLLNGRYIVIIGSKDLFIIMDDHAKNHIDQKIKKEQPCKDNKYFVTSYEYTDIKNIYCVNKQDKLRYTNYFSSINVLRICHYHKTIKKLIGYLSDNRYIKA